MKKLTLLFVLVLSIVVLAACNKTDKTSGTTNGTVTNNTTNLTSATTQNSNLDDCGVDRSNIPTNEIVELQYASIENQEVEQLMLCEFQRQNPNIKVTLRSDVVEMGPADAFSNSIVSLAAIGDVIDVFQVMSMDPLIQNVLVYDITELWNNDPDTVHVLPYGHTSVVYGGKRLGMLNGQVFQGIFVNKTLLDDNNFDLEDYGFDFDTNEIWNYEEMIELATDFTNRARTRYDSNYYWGIDGDWNNLNFAWTLPTMDNLNWGLNSFDGEKFNFTDQNYINHYQREVQLYLDGIKVDVKKDPAGTLAEFGNANPDLFFTEGRVLLYSSYTWNFDLFGTTAHDLMFLPFPKGVGENAVARTVGAAGVHAIAKTTEHPEEAYKLAKFMTWGREGLLTKVEIYNELEERLPKFPISDYDDVWYEIEKVYTDTDSDLYVEGFDLIINTIVEERQAVMDFGKWLPGYNEFKLWYQNVQTESRFRDVNNGLVQFADVAQVWEDKVNGLVQSKMELYAKYPDITIDEE